MSTFTNSVDPDAMPHYALFVKVKKNSSDKRIQYFLKIIDI